MAVGPFFCFVNTIFARSMISVNNIVKEFGGEALFSDISFNISKKERIGLAGKNGAGKTT